MPLTLLLHISEMVCYPELTRFANVCISDGPTRVYSEPHVHICRVMLSSSYYDGINI